MTDCTRPQFRFTFSLDAFQIMSEEIVNNVDLSSSCSLDDIHQLTRSESADWKRTSDIIGQSAVEYNNCVQA